MENLTPMKKSKYFIFCWFVRNTLHCLLYFAIRKGNNYTISVTFTLSYVMYVQITLYGVFVSTVSHAGKRAIE